VSSEELRALAQALMTRPAVRVVPGTSRDAVLAPLKGKKNVGIELGVAGGSFSMRIVESGKFDKVFGVDTYDDYYHHIDEYREAISRVGLMSNYSLLRMTFEEALSLFPDEFFDFIYVDGFAHTGQEGGQTLADWYPKLKVGGIMAGDDYHDDWPLVQWAVNDFASALGVGLSITEKTESHSYNRYPSWFIAKTQSATKDVYRPHPTLVEVAARKKAVIAHDRRRKVRRRQLRQLRARLLGKKPSITT